MQLILKRRCRTRLESEPGRLGRDHAHRLQKPPGHPRVRGRRRRGSDAELWGKFAFAYRVGQLVGLSGHRSLLALIFQFQLVKIMITDILWAAFAQKIEEDFFGGQSWPEPRLPSLMFPNLVGSNCSERPYG